MSLQPTPAMGPAAGTRALRAATAYANTDRGDPGGGFGNALQQALQDVAAAGHAADAQATTALTGGANITEVVTAIAKAELALQTTMAVRDRVVQAYQDIMRMPI
jgi:flagellar hook-basal body complex protein FliE